MNPRLEFFKINLKPKNNSFSTFRDFAVEELKSGKSSIDKTIFIRLHKHFITCLKDDIAKSDKLGKRIYLENKPSINKHLDKKPNFNSEKYIISGVINGGKYGTDRAISNNDDEDDSTSLGRNKTVASYFYFFLYLPPDHNKGFCIIHSNGKEDNISNLMKSYLANLFSGNSYFKAEILDYCPKVFQEEFLNGSIIKKLIFENDFLEDVSSSSGSASILNHFQIKVEAKPKSNNIPVRMLKEVYGVISNNLFGTNNKLLALENFKKKQTTLEGQFNGVKTLEWDLSDNDFIPVVYLKDRIEKNNGDGTPDFIELNEYCNNIFFDEILPELRPDLNVSKIN